MKQDIVLAGVGGQGILSIAFVIDNAALKKGLQIKQAEVHGMAQRGGAVQSHVRISEEPIHSDLIPKGSADIILGVEPLESLRYYDYLSPDGLVVTSSNPLVNIPNYPAIDDVLAKLREFGRVIIVDSEDIARQAGSGRSQNMAMLGAASNFLMVEADDLREFIEALFKGRGDRLVDVNLKAFDLGRQAAGQPADLRK
jgi:indolepyruvate ferredoxin oxidoreductase beta subunit